MSVDYHDETPAFLKDLPKPEPDEIMKKHFVLVSAVLGREPQGGPLPLTWEISDPSPPPNPGDLSDADEQALSAKVWGALSALPPGWADLDEAARIPWLELVIAQARKGNETGGALEGNNGEQPTKPATSGMTWQDAAERAKRLRAQGEPWTSYREIAGRFSCSTQTIHKAIHSSPELTTWAKPKGAAAPRAQNLNPVVTDSTAQATEPDPAEDAADAELRRLIEEAAPDVRAWLHKLTPEQQREFVHDPDKYQKSWPKL